LCLSWVNDASLFTHKNYSTQYLERNRKIDKTSAQKDLYIYIDVVYANDNRKTKLTIISF